jgi:hypothetical protein
MPEMPAPGGGDAFVGFFANTSTWSEYVGACLESPLIAGTTYILNLHTAYGDGVPDFDLSIYGSPTCDDLPWDGTNCPVGVGGWELLDDVVVTYPMDGTWQEVTLIFTPDVDIYSICIGGPCMDPDVMGLADYYFVDELILVDSASFFSIEKTGGWCTDDLELSGVADEPGGDWQWYKDGIALIGETDITFEPIPYGEGEFSVTYTYGLGCDRNDYSSPGIFDVGIDFEVAPCFPAPVSFINSTEYFYDEPYEWIWDVGDGTTSEEFELVHSYDDPGIYDISLIGLSTDASCNDTTTITINIYSPPDAQFEFVGDGLYTVGTTLVGCANNEILFDNLSTEDPLAPIAIIEWDFGDGVTSTDESPTHIYETDGIFDVVLHVENEYGCSDTKTRTIYIADLNPDFTIGDGCVGESMSFFNASAPEGLIVLDSYDWNFGDGATSLAGRPNAYLCWRRSF